MAEFGPSRRSFDPGRLGSEGLRARLPEGFGLTDLVLFVERRLEPERSRALIDGLAGDSELASWLLGARADRDELTRFAEVGRRSGESASGVFGSGAWGSGGGLVAAAMARAEREGVFEVGAEAGGEFFVDDEDPDLIDFAFDEDEPVLTGEFGGTRREVYGGGSQSTMRLWVGGLSAAAAVLAVGIGLGVWMGGGVSAPDDRVVAMGPQSGSGAESAESGGGDAIGSGRSSQARSRAIERHAAPLADSADASSSGLEAQREESFEALASSVVDELASRQAREEPAELRVFSDMPGLATSDSETTSPDGASGGQTAGRPDAGGERVAPRARREILAGAAVRLAERGLLEIVIEKDRNDRRAVRIEQHEALSADGVTIASLNGTDPTLLDARRAAIGRLVDEGRMPASEPFVYLIDLEPTSRRLDRLKQRLEEQTRGRVRFVEADRAIVPSIEAEIWLWTSERPDIRGRARFPLFIVIEE